MMELASDHLRLSPAGSSASSAAQDRHALFLTRLLASEKEIFRYLCAIVPNLTDAQEPEGWKNWMYGIAAKPLEG